MTLLLEQFVNVQQSKAQLADFYVKRNYYLQQHPEKSQTTLLPIDYSKIMEIDTKDIQFLNYVGTQVSEDKKTAYFLTSSMRTPKPIIKQWCDPLMTFHKHCSCYSLLTLR